MYKSNIITSYTIDQRRDVPGFWAAIQWKIETNKNKL